MSDDPFVVRTPGGVLMGYGDVANAKRIDVDAATADPIAEMRRTDRLPDPASLTTGDVADALRFIDVATPSIPAIPAWHDAIIRRQMMLGASPGYAMLRDRLQANLGVEPSTDTMQTVISRLAMKLRKPFAVVRSIPLTDAVKTLDDDAMPDANRHEAGPESEGKEKTGVPPLSEDQQYLLIAVYELSAIDSDSRRTAAHIVYQANLRYDDYVNAKGALADLVHPKNLLNSRRVKGAGTGLHRKAGNERNG